MADILSKKELNAINAYWRAANYLSVGQIYLYDNPLLKEPLKLKHIKPRLLGHWGTTPGLNFIVPQVTYQFKTLLICFRNIQKIPGFFIIPVFACIFIFTNLYIGI